MDQPFVEEDLNALEARVRSLDPNDYPESATTFKPSRDHGIIVSVRFDLDSIRQVRSAARKLGLRQSEFIRGAAIAAAQDAERPQRIRLSIADVTSPAIPIRPGDGPKRRSRSRSGSLTLRYAGGSTQNDHSSTHLSDDQPGHRLRQTFLSQGSAD